MATDLLQQDLHNFNEFSFYHPSVKDLNFDLEHGKEHSLLINEYVFQGVPASVVDNAFIRYRHDKDTITAKGLPFDKTFRDYLNDPNLKVEASTEAASPAPSPSMSNLSTEQLIARRKTVKSNNKVA